VTTKRIELPPKLIPVFAKPRGELRYRAAYGGRGSGKSFTFAKMAAIWGAIEPLRILCTRELQDSIKNSFHAELKNAISSDDWLSSCYDVGVDYLKGHNGTEFIFKGLRHNIGSIKSLAQIDLCIIEEAEDVPEYSWVDLEPTIRAPGSEIWVVWNPKVDGSPVDKRFIKAVPPRSEIASLSYDDNPWFPKELEEQRIQAQKVMDDATYQHIWDGAYLQSTDAQIFNGKYIVDDFEPQDNWDGGYYGLDFGFSQDPTAAVELFIHNNVLYVRREAGRVGLELDDTAAFISKRVPLMADNIIRADSARPESISYLRRHGLKKIINAKKGKGSVEDGISFIKSFDKVVIHTECQQVLNEFRLYSYKVDRLSGDITSVIVDANNHYIDAMRYALEAVRAADTNKLLRLSMS
jgi:phage terminase large subunit